ncbi:MAG TPA: peptidoglycan recognition protein [Solirubrobacteraceae bacterium]|nr:peptidoglycan recognition protein [Solirubrobacteraceae bacterium]
MRRLLALPLLVLATLLAWAAAPALSAIPWRPAAEDFSLDLSVGGDAKAAAAGWRSPVLEAPRRFDLMGLRWSDRGEVDVEIRTRRAGGPWSAWVDAGHGHGTQGSDPVWAGGADVFQVRTSSRPRGLRAHFVNVTGTGTGARRVATTLRRGLTTAVASALGTQPALAQGGGGRPAIVPRSAWGADRGCQPKEPPAYGQVRFGAVHHTVSTNAYGPEDSPGVVLAICRFHRNANGWNDIGYNFLVDRYGRIFEGRAGGVDQAVIGAQAQGFNATSTGVAALGTFSDSAPPDPQLSSIATLLAWKLPRHGAPTTGTVPVRSEGGSASRFARGRTVTLPRISGHRDTGETECPGRMLYDRLGRIRELAARRQGPLRQVGGARLEITEVTPAVWEAPSTVRGVLVGPDGAGVGSRPVALQFATSKGWRTTATTTTGPDGTWSVPTRKSRNWAVRARGGGLTSPSARLSVAPALTVDAPPSAQPGERFTVTGTSSPRKGRLEVHLARPDAAGRYRTLHRESFRTTAGRITAPLRTDAEGPVRVRVFFRADGRNSRGASPDDFICIGGVSCEVGRILSEVGGASP